MMVQKLEEVGLERQKYGKQKKLSKTSSVLANQW
jgi:hypothetical protein